MRRHACSSATVLFGSFFFPLSFVRDSFLRGTLHGPCRTRGIPGTGRDKGGFRDLITSSTIMHADTTHYAHLLPRHGQSVPSASSMLILQSLSTPLSSQKLAQPTLLQFRFEWYYFMSYNAMN